MNTPIDDERVLEQLMRAAQDGDAAAYERLLKSLVGVLRRTVRQRRRFLQPADIEDIVQDILLSLHAVRSSYDPARPFMPWLMAIARNRMADAARRYAHRLENETGGGELPETFSAADTKDAEERLIESDDLAHAMGALPAGQRNALELLKIRELSMREAAAASGSSITALKVAVHRAMLSLRKSLKDER